MMQIDRRYLSNFDYISFFLMLILNAVGLLCIFSATFTYAEPISVYFKKQLAGVGLGLIIYFVFCFLDFRTLERLSFHLYYLLILILIFTLFKGSTALGGQRWINFGFFKFQPSETAKLLFPGFFSFFLETEKNGELNFKFPNFQHIFIVLCISFLLIAKQPDLGTALILLFSASILLWLSGINKKFFLITGFAILISGPILWGALKEYQKKRILVFLGYGDSKKERYQLEQSQIAIGSGGIWGKGFLQSTQNKYQFLPESRTDFIFSVLCEEWGFFGACILLLLYVLLFFRLIYLTFLLKNFFVRLLAIGLISHIAIAVVINICMVMNMLPVVGIPLPFVSYGLANLWINFASLGWFNGIACRRFYIIKN